ncbi:50S ribosomal protein L10 [bacterium]|nr:50S ribosomal protein L10 [bacterium]
MLNKQQKGVVITSLKEDFSTSAASFVVNVKGLTVEKVEKLRKQLRQNDAHLQIAKVRLMKRALMGDDKESDFSPYMKEQIALVFAQKDAANIAKILCTFTKEADAFKVIAGYMDARLFDEKSIKAIAALPSREVMLAYLVGVLQSPMSEMVRVLQAMIAAHASTDNAQAVEEKKESE